MKLMSVVAFVFGLVAMAAGMEIVPVADPVDPWGNPIKTGNNPK
jgi:hypothetical protein